MQKAPQNTRRVPGSAQNVVHETAQFVYNILVDLFVTFSSLATLELAQGFPPGHQEGSGRPPIGPPETPGEFQKMPKMLYTKYYDFFFELILIRRAINAVL